MALYAELGAVGEFEVALARRHLGEHRRDLDVGILGPGDFGVQLLQRNQPIDVARAGDDLDPVQERPTPQLDRAGPRRDRSRLVRRRTSSALTSPLASVTAVANA